MLNKAEPEQLKQKQKSLLRAVMECMQINVAKVRKTQMARPTT